MDLMLSEYSAAPGSTVVEVSGEIDVYTAPRLREMLVSLVDAGNYRLIVDMERVEFLDSTGLGVLVGGLKRVRAYDGGIDLVCTQGRILRIFRITGLSKVFNIFDTVEEALASHAKPEIRLDESAEGPVATEDPADSKDPADPEDPAASADAG